MRRRLQRLLQPYHEYLLIRQIRKLSKAIWKYGLKGVEPKFKREDATDIAMGILWNDADRIKKVLSYTNEYGTRVFPR